MKSKTLFVSLIFCLVLCLSLTAVASAEDVKTIFVNGEGTVSIVPDIIHISIGVSTEGENITETINENSAKVNAVREAITARGIASEDIKTTNYNLYTQQKYYSDTNEMSDEYIYTVNNNFQITVRDLNILNDVLNACVDAGANNINSIEYDTAKRDEANDLAREYAIDDAIDKAQKVADKLGVTLTSVQNITVGSQDFYYGNSTMTNARMDGVGGADTPDISAGSMVVSVHVDLTYAFTE